MTLPTRKSRKRQIKILIAFVTLSLAGAGLPSPSIASTDDVPSEGPQTKAPLFAIYRGAEPKRVHSKSIVDGARGQHVFEPALQGDLVLHDFIITNDRQDVLELRNVDMCTGCLLDGYSKSIQPGLQGRLSMFVPTDPYGGQEVSGPITVETNDPDRPTIRIDVSLPVREFASVSPYRVWLKGAPSTEIVASCIVIPNHAFQFSITAIRARKGVWFSHSYEE